MVCDKLHDYFDHVPVWQQKQKLAGDAAVPYSIIGCCEIKNAALAFFFLWTILEVDKSSGV